MFKSLKNLLIKYFLFRDSDKRRMEWVEKILLKLNANSKILDAGCGPQQYKQYCKHLNYYSQDFAKYNGKGDGKGLQKNNWKYGELDYIGDIWKIDEKDNFFDVILCTEVLEHIMYPNETIKEFSRLLKKNGVLILTAPVNSTPHFSPYYFYNGFSEYFYQNTANTNNFKIISIESNGNIYESIASEIILSTKYLAQPYKLIYKALSIIFILILQLFSKLSKKSNTELLSGYHVVMVKL